MLNMKNVTEEFYYPSCPLVGWLVVVVLVALIKPNHLSC